MSETETLIPLPEGYRVEKTHDVGYTYYDEKGEIVMQNPSDTNAMRRVIWSLKKRETHD